MLPGMGLERQERFWVAEKVWASVGQAEAGRPLQGLEEKQQRNNFSRESGHVSGPVSCSDYEVW